MYARIANMMRMMCVILLAMLSVNPLFSQNCTGTPTAGTVTATAGGASSTTMVMSCSATQVTFDVSGQTTDNGIELQWQTSYDNTVWSDINSATTATYLLNVAEDFVTSYFRIKVSCTASGAVAYSNAVMVSFPMIQGYNLLPFTESFEGGWAHICRDGELPAPMGPFAWRNWPQSGNSSWRREDSYLDGEWSSDFGAYTPGGSDGDHSARFHSTYGTEGHLDLFLNMSATPGTKKLSFDYINADGDDKLVLWLSTDGGASFTRLDSVATAAAWTTKKMYISTLSSTVIIRFNGVADNGNSDIGLDNIKVEAVTTCTGTPAIGVASSDNNTVCADHTFTLGLDALPANTEAISYQWQSSPAGAGTWQDITGAVKETYTGAQTMANDYRVKVSCQFGGDVYSNIVPVAYTYGVSGTGYTINSALPTSGNNFASFNDAYNFLKCGVSGPVIFTVSANGSPYNEQLILESIQGMSAVNTVTFKGNGNRIHFSSVDNEERAVIKLRGADFFIFDSLEIDASRDDNTTIRYGYGVHLMNDADFNVFRHCRIIADTTFSSSGIVAVVINGSNTDQFDAAGNCDSNVFEADTIIGGQYGVYITAAVSAPNSLNRIANCVIRDFDTRGVSLFGTNNTVIEGNTFSCLYRTTMGSVGSYIYGEGGSNGTQISKNRFTHPFGLSSSPFNSFFGIIEGMVDNWPNAGTQITNNVFYDICKGNLTNAIMVSFSNAFIFHNTIDLSASAGASNISLTGIRVTTPNNNSVILNNMITGSNTLPGQVWGLFTFGSSIIADNNVYHLAGAATNNIGHLGDNDYATLNDWRQGANADANGVSTDPQYEDLAAGNLKPQSRKANNRGTPLGIATDITGAARDMATPDAGAYEFDPQACTPLHTGTYTIDRNAPAGPTNFISFNAAKDAMNCGIDGPVVFDVKNGTYNEQLILPYIEGTSDVNTVTFKGNGNTIQYSSTISYNRAVVKLDGASHIVFDSLTIDAAPKGDATGKYGYGVQFINDADSNVIRHCNILTDTTLHGSDQHFAAIVMTPVDEGTDANGDTRCNGDTITDNRLSGGTYSILVAGTASGLVFTNNRILNFELMGMSFNHSLSDVLVEGNEISRPSFGGPDFYGIRLSGGDGQSSHFVITRNTIHNVFTPDVTPDHCEAILLSGLNKGVASTVLAYVTNNLIYDLKAPHRSMNGILLDDADNVIMAHNTISLDGVSDGLAGSSGAGIGIGTGVTGIVTNNIVSVTSKGAGVRSAVSTIAPSADLTFLRNNYTISDDPGNYTGTIGGLGQFRTLTDWQTAVAGDDNTTSIEPLFRDTASGDFTPTAEAIDNLGRQIGVFVDIHNAPRSFITPDLGAYEFTVPVCTSPPEAGKAVATPDGGICTGAVIALTVKDNSIGAGQRYIWQKAAAANGPWTDISDTLIDGRIPFQTTLTADNYFRCLVTCSGKTDSSEVAIVNRHATMPASLDTVLRVCMGTPVQLLTYAPVSPASLIWQLSSVTGVTPSADDPEQYPNAKDSVLVSGIKYYRFMSHHSVAFTRTGEYTIPVTITDDAIEACNHTIQSVVKVHVEGQPFAGFAVPTQPCVGDPVFFAAQDTIAGGAMQQWQWDYGNGTTATTHNGTTSFDRAGNYQVHFTATSTAGCEADSVRSVTVTDCRTNLFIPNAFTPNGDNNNDVLKVYGVSIKAIHLMIFNQWGQKIFETRNQDEGWDGTFKGSKQPSGVYMYVCKISLADGSDITKKGAVNLIR